MICSACKKTLKPSEKVVCSNTICGRCYHQACVGLSADAVKKVPSWVCPLCASKQPRPGDNSDTPVKLSLAVPVLDEHVTVRRRTPTPTSSPQPEAVLTPTESHKEMVSPLSLKALQEAITAQLKSLGDRMTGIEQSIKHMSDQYDDIIGFYSNAKVEMAALHNENKELREELEATKARTKRLEDEHARQDQWSRMQNVELVGVPETKNECAVDIVVKIAAVVGVAVAPGDVEFAHRVQARRPASTGSSSTGRAIVARFRQRATKDALVAGARKHRNITTQSLGMEGERKRVYVNEHLTKDNKQLFKSCKLKAAESNFKHIWTKNCRIYVRKTDVSPPIPIISTLDLGKMQ